MLHCLFMGTQSRRGYFSAAALPTLPTTTRGDWMAIVKRVLFKKPYFESGLVKYEAGCNYPVTAETKAAALAGEGEHATAEFVEVDMDDKQHAAESAAAEAAWRTKNAMTVAADPALRDAVQS
jgi:hypothetical protein